MANERKLESRVNGHLSEWYCTACGWSVVVSGTEKKMPEQDVHDLFDGHVCAGNKEHAREN